MKATIKAVLLYALYLLLWALIAPLAQIVPGLEQLVEAFVGVYVGLIVIGTLASGTFLEHIFNVAKAMFVLIYLLFSLRNGMVGMAFQNVTLTIDIGFFIVFAMLLGLLGLAKSLMQAISYVNQKAEHPSV